MSEKGDRALNQWVDMHPDAHILGDLNPTKENIDGLQDLLLLMDQEGTLPLNSKLSEFLQHALTLLEEGKPVVFTATDPEPEPEPEGDQYVMDVSRRDLPFQWLLRKNGEIIDRAPGTREGHNDLVERHGLDPSMFIDAGPRCGAQYGSNPDLCNKPAGHEIPPYGGPRTADTAVHHNKWGTVWV